MIDKYRNDIHLVHQGLALPRNVVHGMADALGHGREARHRQVGGEVEPVSVPLPGHADLRLDPMFQQIQGMWPGWMPVWAARRMRPASA